MRKIVVGSTGKKTPSPPIPTQISPMPAIVHRISDGLS